MMTGDRMAKHHLVLDTPDLALLAGFCSELPGLLLTYGSQGWVVIAENETTLCAEVVAPYPPCMSALIPREMATPTAVFERLHAARIAYAADPTQATPQVLVRLPAAKAGATRSTQPQSSCDPPLDDRPPNTSITAYAFWPPGRNERINFARPARRAGRAMPGACCQWSPPRERGAFRPSTQSSRRCG